MIAKINFDGNDLDDIQLSTEVFSSKARLHRSLNKFVVLIGASLLSILIPVLHFILVPMFLILSFVMAYKTYLEVLAVKLIEFSCPGCKSHFKNKVIGLKNNDLNIRLTCLACRRNTTIMFEGLADEYF